MYRVSRISLIKTKKAYVNISKLSTKTTLTPTQAELTAFRLDLETKGEKARKEFNFKNIAEMQIKSCKRYKDKPLFGVKSGPKFDWVTFDQFGKLVQRFRNVLVHHKIGKNDKVGIISNNRVEWAVAMYAVASLGGQLVPM